MIFFSPSLCFVKGQNPENTIVMIFLTQKEKLIRRETFLRFTLTGNNILGIKSRKPFHCHHLYFMVTTL